MRLWFLLFTLIPLSGLAYVVWHVWAILPLSTWLKTTIATLLVLCFLCLFLQFGGVSNRIPLRWGTVLYEIGTSSIFILLYLVMIFLVLDLGRLILLVSKTWLYHSPVGSLSILLLTVAIFVYGNIHYNNKVRQPLTLKTDKPLKRPLRVIMASDLHIGYHNRRSELRRWVDMMNKEKADLILIAGDIIDGSMRPLQEEAMHEEFLRLNAPVYACLGNHEYFSGEPDAERFYRAADIRLLRDTCETIGSHLCIVGRDDRSNPRRKELSDIMKHADQNLYTIVLDHQPYHLEESEQCFADFQFSGHTHHGQVWPISWITDAIYEKAFGEHQRGKTRYYISSGLGIWGGKFRIGTRSEYIVATIEN